MLKIIIKSLVVAAVLSVFMAGCSLPEKCSDVSFYVAPDGDDSANGSINAPFRTLEAARDAVRRLRAEGKLGHDGVTVNLRAGRYEISETFELDERDSGTQTARIIYRSFPGEKVYISGGKSIPASAFKPVGDKKVLDRFVDKRAASKIVCVDLNSLGITNYGKMSARGFRRPYVNPGLELFFNEQAMTIARWPNEGFVPIGKVVDKGSVPRFDDFENRGGTFHYKYDRADYWKQADDIYVSGNWKAPYADDTLKVEEIDTEQKTIKLAYAHMYGIASGPEWCNYFVLNLLEEIDVPGEWYLDRNTGMLYFYPPSDIAEGDIQVSLLDEPMVAMEGVSFVSFENITFEYTRGIGVYIERGEGNLLAGCTLRNMGVVAVCMGMGIEPDKINRHQFTGKPVSRQLGSWHEHIYENATYNRQAGKNHGVLSCDIYNIGAGAVSMGGGDRLTLEPGRNYVENCEIHDYNRLGRSYKAAVNIDGVGNRIANNHIYNAPDMAVYLHGNDHVIEYNHIHHVMLESGEGGWFYMGRDAAEFGNEIRYNFVHHCGVTDSGSEGDRTEGSSGVYMDDFACGTKVYQNVFYKVGKERAAVLINGGMDNLVCNNIFIDCRYALYASALFQGWAKKHLTKFDEGGLYRVRLEEVNYKNPPYSEKYPTLVNICDDEPAQPKRNLMKNNVYVDCGKVYRWNKEPKITLEGNFETDADPGFVDMAALNFQLKEDSLVYKQIPDFKRIPLEKVGMYVDRYRTEVVPYVHRAVKEADIKGEVLNDKINVEDVVSYNDEGVIVLLEKIPVQYPDGEVAGVKIAEALVADVSWADGELRSVIIYSSVAGEFVVKYKENTARIKTEPEGKYGLDKNLKDIWF
ncbi:MAG: right-handed parallel beta-helix repeat-containing protein [Sedimentisphaeraceae bacterium JB056]